MPLITNDYVQEEDSEHLVWKSITQNDSKSCRVLKVSIGGQVTAQFWSHFFKQLKMVQLAPEGKGTQKEECQELLLGAQLRCDSNCQGFGNGG